MLFQAANHFIGWALFCSARCDGRKILLHVRTLIVSLVAPFGSNFEGGPSGCECGDGVPVADGRWTYSLSFLWSDVCQLLLDFRTRGDQLTLSSSAEYAMSDNVSRNA